MHDNQASTGTAPGSAADASPSPLLPYGYRSAFESAFEEFAPPGTVPARILDERRSGYGIVADIGGRESFLAAELGRKLAYFSSGKASLPAVGDWVAVRPPVDGGVAIVVLVLPRASRFSRKAAGSSALDPDAEQVIAANVDLACAVAAAGRDFNPRRIERYIALAWESGARPLLVLTKADLAVDRGALLAEAMASAPGVEVRMVHAPSGEGIAELASLMAPAETLVLLGSSGAGKSTLLNALAGGELASTGEVREDDQRGKHTTTSRSLYRLASGALVIDTPGLREVQLWGSGESVAEAFPEIAALADRCRFRDCAHEREPGCAVREALESGAIDPERYRSWRKLAREIARLECRSDPAARRARVRELKARWKSYRSRDKESPKRRS